MAEGTHTVEAEAVLDVPVADAYERLQDPTAMALLIGGIDDVRPLANTTLVHSSFGGQARSWELQIVDEAPGRHVTWDRTDGPGSAEVRFRPAGPRRTRVKVLVYGVQDAPACQTLLEQELRRVQDTIVAVAGPAATAWGVAGPW